MSESQVGWGFPEGASGGEPACSARDLGSVPGLGSSPGGGRGNPLQYSCLENPMNRGASWAAVHGPPTESEHTPSGWVAADAGWLGRASPRRGHFQYQAQGLGPCLPEA